MEPEIDIENTKNSILQYLNTNYPNKILTDSNGKYNKRSNAFILTDMFANLLPDSREIILKNVRLAIKEHNEPIEKKNKEDKEIEFQRLVKTEKKLNNIITNYQKKEKFFIDFINNNSLQSIFELGKQYQNEKNYEYMLFYYNNLIEKYNNNYSYEEQQILSETLCTLAMYYKKIENFDLMKTYHLMAIENGNLTSMNNLGFYYETLEKNEELMKKYYLMAIENGHTTSMYNLGSYYECIEDEENMYHYYFMACKYNQINAIESINKLMKDKHPVKIYQIYTKFEIEIHKNILNDDRVIKYINKCNFLSKLYECSVCYENKQCIPLECVHYFCIDCYPKILSAEFCPCCRCKT
jgi:hypothetical protein